MAPKSPGLFGRFGTLGALEKQLEQTQKIQQSLKDVRKELVQTFGKEAVKQGESAKKSYAEIKTAMELVNEELKDTDLTAKEYGKTLQKDSKAILDFAKKHKISLSEAAESYKKVRGAQSNFFKGFKDKAKNWAGTILTAASAAKVYGTRVEEVRTGHQMFLAQTALVSKTGSKAWGDVTNYIEGYRHATRRARDITGKYGAEVGEVQSTIKGMGSVLRGQIGDSKDFGKVILEDTDRLYAFSRMMNVQVGDAMDFFKSEMRDQGKTHAEARKSLDMVIGSYGDLADRVSATARPFKEEYLATLKGIKAEMGPTQVSTVAMTSAMNFLAEAASKAGLSSKGVSDTMAAIPKLLKGLPRFYQQKVGGGMLHMVTNNKKFRAELGKSNKLLLQQMDTLRDADIPIWEKKEMATRMMSGTKEGMSAIFRTLKTMAPAQRFAILKGMGLDDRQLLAIQTALKKGDPKALDRIGEGIKKQGKKATDVRKTLADNLFKNTKGLDKMALQAKRMEEMGKGLITQYQELIPAIGLLSKMIASDNLQKMFGGLGGKLGFFKKGLGDVTQSLAGKAGMVGAVAGAALAGWEFGKWLDKKFGISDKISNTLFELDKEMLTRIERSKQSVGTEKSLTSHMKLRIDQMAKLQEQGITEVGRPGKTRALTRGFMRNWLETQMKEDIKHGKINKDQIASVRAAIEKQIAIFPKKEDWKSGKQKRLRIAARQKEIDKLRKASSLTKKEEGKQAKAQVKEAKASAMVKGRIMADPSMYQQKQEGPTSGGGDPHSVLTPEAQALQSQASTKFDEAMKEYQGTFTLKADDPAFQGLMKEAVSKAAPKRGR